MIPEVVAVKVAGPHSLRLAFRNGVAKQVDLPAGAPRSRGGRGRRDAECLGERDPGRYLNPPHLLAPQYLEMDLAN
jgi:hypothetical protein